MLPDLQKFINFLSEVKYFEELKDDSNIEAFLFDTYEPILEIMGTDSLSFNLTNEEF
jgi:hypothetical protein